MQNFDFEVNLQRVTSVDILYELRIKKLKLKVKQSKAKVCP
jgi:hypothetical protein